MAHHSPVSSGQQMQATLPPRNSTQDEALLTVGEVARRLRVDTTTVRRWISTGTLDAVVLPHRGKRQAYRIRQGTLDRLLHTPAASMQ
ncbi:MAG: helix-turn-helix domain-containing protein [Ktedonobacteraceae bacterium]|jgi:excisionase family DNA binding protein